MHKILLCGISVDNLKTGVPGPFLLFLGNNFRDQISNEEAEK